EGAPVGLLAVAGDCDGLYVSDAISWQAIERAEGVLARTVTVDPTETAVVLDGPGGTLVLEPVDADTLDVWLSLPDGAVFVEETSWDGRAVDVEIVSDPWASGLFRGVFVSVNGQVVLRDLFATPDLTAIAVSPGVDEMRSDDGGVPVCRTLVERGADGDR
ncbi:MAG: hypothetical protein AAF081_12390, partial [Actinomycetota bacterium]